MKFEIVCVQRAVKIQQNAIEHFTECLDVTFSAFNYTRYRKVCTFSSLLNSFSFFFGEYLQDENNFHMFQIALELYNDDERGSFAVI